jgi:hypothetical protein
VKPALVRLDDNSRSIRIGHNPEVFDNVSIRLAVPFRPNIFRANPRIRIVPGHAENNAIAWTK